MALLKGEPPDEVCITQHVQHVRAFIWINSAAMSSALDDYRQKKAARGVEEMHKRVQEAEADAARKGTYAAALAREAVRVSSIQVSLWRAQLHRPIKSQLAWLPW